MNEWEAVEIDDEDLIALDWTRRDELEAAPFFRGLGYALLGVALFWTALGAAGLVGWAVWRVIAR